MGGGIGIEGGITTKQFLDAYSEARVSFQRTCFEASRN